MYNEKHQAFVFRTGQKVTVFQKGAREYLLCRECETRFSRYERYAAESLFRRDLDQDRQVGKIAIVSGLQYAPLKLFMLSVLWRLSETSLTTLKGAELGPHKRRLWQALSNEDPRDQLFFPCVTTQVSLNGVLLHGWILPPKRSRPDGFWVWNVALGAFLFSYYVASHSIPEGIIQMVLSPGGKLGVYREDIRHIRGLKDAAARLAKIEF